MTREEKLKAAKAWFANETEADPELIGFMGITPDRLIEMWEAETAQ